MATPTMTNIYPASSHIGGNALVRVLGGDFRVPPSPLVTGYVGLPTTGIRPLTPTVRVRFGTAAALEVQIVNHALLYARVPPSPLGMDAQAAAAGAVDVTVENLDDDGAVIPGESFTLPSAFTYRDAIFTEDSGLARIVRALIRELKRQVLKNTILSNTHSDYDAATGDTYNLTEVQQLPSLVLVGPELEWSDQPDVVEYVPALGHQVQMRRTRYADLRFAVIGSADKHQTILNLQAIFIAFFEAHPYLVLDKDPADPAQGKVQFELEIERGGAPSISTGGDDANVLTFGARIVIRQVPVQGLPGIAEEGTGGVIITTPISEVVCDVTLDIRQL